MTGGPGLRRLWLAAFALTVSEAALRASGAAAASPSHARAAGGSSVWAAAWGPFAVAGGVGVLVLVAASLVFTSFESRWVRLRLAPHLGQRRQSAKQRGRRRGMQLVRSLLAATERTLANVKQFRAVERALERADLPLSAAELLYACVGSGAVFGLLLAIVSGSTLVALLGFAAGAWVPLVVVKQRAARRLKALDTQLPDVLLTIAASLKAGHSFRQAIQSIVDEGAQPLAKEFSRVLAETQLGRPMDQALVELAERVGSKNLTFVVTAVTIQRQVGGSLAGLFDTVAETVRQRQQFQRKVRGLTAMGRLSAYILVGLPFVMAAAVTLLSPHYMAPLYDTSSGHMMIAVGVAMITLGSLVLKRMIAFRD